jgi:Sec-independent protein translocase protein TatA
MSEFDGVGFAELLIVLILVVLFAFGTTDIDTLSSTPTKA